MTEEKYYIGVDGGGTKTHAVITDSSLKVIAEVFAGPSNVQIEGPDSAAAVITELIERCCVSTGCTTDMVKAVGCGLAGAGRAADQERTAAALKQCAAEKGIVLKNIAVENDARAALEGAFAGGPGIVLVSGTGSIAFAKDPSGTVHRAGGWGRYLDDEGSGYCMGRKAVAALGRVIDGIDKETPFTAEIADSFGFTDQKSIIDAVYRKGFDLASVAPLVLKYAAEGDGLCESIVDEAAAALGSYVNVLCGKLDGAAGKGGGGIPLVFSGGLISNGTVLSGLLRELLSVELPCVSIVSPAYSPAIGAVLLCRSVNGLFDQ